MTRPGLVSYETSAPRPPVDPLVLDPARGRLRRMRQSVTTAARLHAEAGRFSCGAVHCWMVTLTYADPDAWSPRHISASVDAFRKRCKRDGIPLRYVWVAEIQLGRLQRTGVPVVHYHLVLWLPAGVDPGFWDSGRGVLGCTVAQSLWPHGSTNRKRVYAPTKYVAKYASKGTSDVQHFPRGARIHAVGGLDTWANAELRWWKAPRWVKDFCEVSDQPVRVSGGFVLRASGEFISSPWSCLGVHNGRVWLVPSDSPWAGLSISDLFSVRFAVGEP